MKKQKIGDKTIKRFQADLPMDLWLKLLPHKERHGWNTSELLLAMAVCWLEIQHRDQTKINRR